VTVGERADFLSNTPDFRPSPYGDVINLLFEYVGLELTPLSKPSKTKEQAEKAREKYHERLRNGIAVGVIRTKK
jgi:hypothetical protein